MHASSTIYSSPPSDPAGKPNPTAGSSRRRWGIAGATAILLATVAAAAVATPAYAVTVSYGCESGSYKPSLGRLGAFGCTGSGATNVYVSVATLDVVNGPIDVPATLFCTDFGPSGVAGHFAGDCVVYSYP